MQLDDEVVQHFKKLAADSDKGDRYTALINEALLRHVQALKGGKSNGAGVSELAHALRLELEQIKGIS